MSINTALKNELTNFTNSFFFLKKLEREKNPYENKKSVSDIIRDWIRDSLRDLSRDFFRDLYRDFQRDAKVYLQKDVSVEEITILLVKTLAIEMKKIIK